MKANLTGRAIKGCGCQGQSNSPCSQSGVDPSLIRGKSSQLNFEMLASPKQLQSISLSFKKLRDIRFGRSAAQNIHDAYKASQDFNKPAFGMQSTSPEGGLLSRNVPISTASRSIKNTIAVEKM